MPGGKPGGLKPGGGAGMPGGANGTGGRPDGRPPTIRNEYEVSLICKRYGYSPGGIIPIPRPAGMPRPGPTGS